MAIVAVYVDVFDGYSPSEGIDYSYLLVTWVQEICADTHEQTWAGNSLQSLFYSTASTSNVVKIPHLVQNEVRVGVETLYEFFSLVEHVALKLVAHLVP